MYGEEFYQKTAMMGRNFIGFQHMRMAAGARARRFREEDQSKELIKIQLDYIKVLTKDEKQLLKDMVKLYEPQQATGYSLKINSCPRQIDQRVRRIPHRTEHIKCVALKPRKPHSIVWINFRHKNSLLGLN